MFKHKDQFIVYIHNAYCRRWYSFKEWHYLLQWNLRDEGGSGIRPKTNVPQILRRLDGPKIDDAIDKFNKPEYLDELLHSNKINSGGDIKP